jgi:hypothetical protein
MVTVSDEAFALSLVENCMDTWVKKFDIQRKRLPMGRFDGVFSAATKGTLVFGGGLNKDGTVSTSIVSWFKKIGAVPGVLMLKKPFSQQCSRHQKGGRFRPV